tara:strand:- start:1646 stop:2749 length:1104 start_codon:yes stop_codon:yes gene_type:complete
VQLRKFHVTLDDGGFRSGEVAGVAYGDPSTPVEIMFLHANGYNGVTYQSILQPLASQAHVAAVDMRGHGMTMLPVEPGRLRSWDVLRDDMITTIEKAAPGGLILGGHSLGATVALMVAAKAPHLIDGLVLVDPVVLSPTFYKFANMPILGRLTTFGKLAKDARNRNKTRFASREEAQEYYASRGGFKTWRTPFLHDFLIDGLTWVADQNFELSCQPEWESAVFAAQANRPWRAFSQLGKYREREIARLRQLAQLAPDERQEADENYKAELQAGNVKSSRLAKNIPMIILQADKNSTCVEDMDRRVHAFLPDAAVTRIPGTTHFLPMERPYVVRDALDILYRTRRGDFEDDYIGAVKRTINDAIGVMG